MSTPSPFTPKHSFLEFAGTRERRRHRFAVVIGVAAGLILSLAFVEFGCRRNAERAESADLSKTTSAVTTPTNALGTGRMEEAPRAPSPPGPSPVSNVTPQVAEPESSGLTPAPQIAATPKLALNPESRAYRVKKGDTFAKIGLAHNVTIEAIVEANPDADSRQLRIGQELQIPVVQDAQPSPTDPGSSAEASGSPQIYTVKKGDTLSQIATIHGTTVKAIRAINELKTNRIVVGQQLKLPSPNPPARLPDANRSGVTNSAL